jgi:2-polyprenyl-3-methyl-5-hydroxy-6-metoxy-1,4-benzoquinol methylase
MAIMTARWAKDLDAWMPRLLAAWRRARRTDGPPDRLTPAELASVSAGVRELSQGLTRARELAGAQYLDDPRLLGAYLLFYWPVSYAQAREVLGELPQTPGDTLDLGSGPGPMAFAALDAGATRVTAADRSAPALELARKLAADAGRKLETHPWDPTKSPSLPSGSFDVITLGHVLNELHGSGAQALERRVALVESLLARVRPSGSLVIVEPALRETSRDLLQLRDRLVAAGVAVRAPCLYRGACPALTKESDWCHAERAWSPPPLVDAIARAALLHKDALKMSYLILASPGEAWPEPPPGRLFRIVSESLATKGRARFIGCGPEGRTGLALPDKHVTDGNAAFSTLRRGDLVRIGATLPKGDALALGKDSEVTVVVPVGGKLPHPKG